MNRLNSFLFIFIIGGFLFSCRSTDNNPGGIVADPDINVVSVTREQAEAIGLQFGKLQQMMISNDINANGLIDTPPENRARISSIVSGKVLRINYLEGDEVKKGSQIILLESMEYLEIQKNYLTAKSNLKFLEDNYLRQKKLSEENVNARKVFLESESIYLSARAEFEFINKKLSILKANKAEIEKGNFTPYLSISSSIDGFISSINTTSGEYVDAEDVMVEVINPNHLHAELRVYERDMLKVRKGQKVEITARIEEIELTGEIFLVGKALDPDTRSIPVHVHLSNEENLVPGMYVEGKILLDEQSVLALPEEGLVREESRTMVYMLMEEKENELILKRIRVIPGEEKDKMVAIEFPSPIDTSKMVAISGVYYISSASE